MSKAETDLHKRSTDCVYFLASPLTCKKGMDCEYRHSDVARLNPRDCWYWLSGSCFNPACAFRHPPLDNEHPSEPLPPATRPPPTHVTKTNVPCYYYFNGFCNKGDRCSFLHTPEKNRFAWKLTPPISEFPIPLEPKTHVSVTMEKPASLLPTMAPKSTTPDELYNSMTKSATAANHVKSVKPKIEDAGISEGIPRAESSGRGRLVERLEAEERRESSPGFDVLVDDRPDECTYEDDPDYTLQLGSEDDRFLGHGSVFRDVDASANPETDASPDFNDGCRISYSGLLVPTPSPRKRATASGNGSFGMDLRDHLKKRRRASMPVYQCKGLASEIMRNGESLVGQPRNGESLVGQPNSAEVRRRLQQQQYWGRKNFVASVVSVEKDETFSGLKMFGEIRDDKSVVSPVCFFEGPKPLSEILKDRKKGGGHVNGMCSSSSRID